ncbi:MAG: DciA family protein [Candidatus Moraniibacteriota bacterium]
MRSLKDLLPKKQRASSEEVDEKTIFHIAKRVLVEEYGVRGGDNIIPTYYKEKKLFLSPRSSLWASEVYLMRSHLAQRINEVLGGDVVQEIKITQQM